MLKYDKAQGRLVNVAEDVRGSPYYALRDRQGNAIGVTACDIDGDGREEIYFLNTNNAFSGEPRWQPSPGTGGAPGMAARDLRRVRDVCGLELISQLSGSID